MIPDKNTLAVSLSDRTIVFFDTQTTNKIIKQFHVPSTQKCLTYIERKKVLFSAGVDGAIFAWNMNMIGRHPVVNNDLANTNLS